jgi:3-oxoacyl-[acyl-carrier protein] reductase
MESLTDRIALVTGASRGIGRESAIALAAAGADVVVNYRAYQDEAERTCARITELKRRCLPVRADVSVAAEVKGLVETVQSTWGPISILVNNAGISRPQPLVEIAERDWDELIRVNLKSVFLVTQAVLPGMRALRWGRIINISSTAAQTGGVIGPHYAASKAGMLGLTHSYASLLVKEGVTANAIAPALIETDMLKGIRTKAADLIPVGRFGRPEEVGEVVVMLARNGYITGQTINVNGGYYMS